MAEGEGFLGRWSRRKQQAREVLAAPEPAPPPPPPVQGGAGAGLPAVEEGLGPGPAQREAAPPGHAEGGPEAPSLEDARALTPQSDFKPFVARGVAPEVRNAAMKKLFADPHFNTMDGLDVYIDDYTRPDPLPAAMLRQLASAKFMRLVEDEEEAAGAAAAPRAGDDVNTPTAADVAQSDLCNELPSQPTALPVSAGPVASRPLDADPDLRLQQDHAAGRPGPGRSTA